MRFFFKFSKQKGSRGDEKRKVLQRENWQKSANVILIVNVLSDILQMTLYLKNTNGCFSFFGAAYLFIY